MIWLRVELRDTAPHMGTAAWTSTDIDSAPTCTFGHVRRSGRLLRDEEVALARWRAGRRDGRLAMPSHDPLTSTLTTTRCRRAGRARTTPDR